MSPFRDPINTLSTADPPDHTAHRSLLQPALSPGALAELEPKVRTIVAEQFAPLLAAGGGDFVAAFSEVVPARTICAIIGIPEVEAPRVIELVAGTGALLDGTTDPDGMNTAMGYAAQLYRFVPGHLATALALAPDQRTGLFAVLGDGITDGIFSQNDVCSVLLTLVSAGSDTTASLLAAATERLARNPELQDRLRSHPDQIPDVIEAVLRADGPFQFHYRYAPHDTVIGGVAVPAHSRVMVMWAAANLPDPTPDPSARCRRGEPSPAAPLRVRARHPLLHRRPRRSHGSPPGDRAPARHHVVDHPRPRPPAHPPAEHLPAPPPQPPHRGRALVSGALPPSTPRNRLISLTHLQRLEADSIQILREAARSPRSP